MVKTLFPFSWLLLCPIDAVLFLTEASQFRELLFIILILAPMLTAFCSVPMSTRLFPGFSSIRLRVSGFVSRSVVHLKLSFATCPSSSDYGAERAGPLPYIQSTQSPAVLETKVKFSSGDTLSSKTGLWDAVIEVLMLILRLMVVHCRTLSCSFLGTRYLETRAMLKKRVKISVSNYMERKTSGFHSTFQY